jgi:hypothetical protein
LSGTIPDALVPTLNGLRTCALSGSGLSCPLPAGLTKLACNPASCAMSAQDALQYCGAGDDPVQCAALVDFAIALSFATWMSNYADVWLQGGSYCTWPGVTCPVLRYNINTPEYNQTVTGLSLNNVGLRGTLPSSFGSLSALTSLSLYSAQQLTGSLPSSFTQLTSLQTLVLYDLPLTGTLDALASLPELVSVSLMYVPNLQTAVLPNFVSPVLADLMVLYTNSVASVQLPAWNLPALTSLTLDNMPTLTGSFPPASAFPALRSLRIATCAAFNGVLPALPAGLNTITISDTPLTGDLTSLAASGFTNLTSLLITGASLSGTIPDALVPTLNGLRTCALSGSGLSCPLPAGLTKLACNPASC